MMFKKRFLCAIFTWWMSQWLSSAGVWTCCVFLSTERLRWELRRSSLTWCQCWSSSRLPTEMRSWPPDDELIPAWTIDQWHHHDDAFNHWHRFPFLLRIYKRCMLQRHVKVSPQRDPLHNTFLTRTNISLKMRLVSGSRKTSKARVWFIKTSRRRCFSGRTFSSFVSKEEQVTEVTRSH